MSKLEQTSPPPVERETTPPTEEQRIAEIQARLDAMRNELAEYDFDSHSEHDIEWLLAALRASRTENETLRKDAELLDRLDARIADACGQRIDLFGPRDTLMEIDTWGAIDVRALFTVALAREDTSDV